MMNGSITAVELANEENKKKAWMQCPITMDDLDEPVVLSSGQTIDKASFDGIKAAAVARREPVKCPITRLDVVGEPIPNRALKDVMAQQSKPNLSVEEKEEPLRCPITHEIFYDPVIVSSGYTYERKALQDGNVTQCPMTRQPIGRPVTNYAVKHAVDDYLQENPERKSEQHAAYVARPEPVVPPVATRPALNTPQHNAQPATRQPCRVDGADRPMRQFIDRSSASRSFRPADTDAMLLLLVQMTMLNMMLSQMRQAQAARSSFTTGLLLMSMMHLNAPAPVAQRSWGASINKPFLYAIEIVPGKTAADSHIDQPEESPKLNNFVSMIRAY